MEQPKIDPEDKYWQGGADADKRDGFAACAMQALLSNTVALQDILRSSPHDDQSFAEALALNAYGVADAMMRVRQRKPAPVESP